MRRVVITGIGLVTPFGSKHDAVWAALEGGHNAVRFVDAPEGGGRVLGAPVTGFNPRDFIDVKSLRLMAPAVAFGVAASQLAVDDADLKTETLDPARFGAFVGSRGHSSDRQDLVPAVKLSTLADGFNLATFGGDGLPLVHPMWLLKGLANNVLYFVSLRFNAQGMNNNISMGGVAGTMAVGEAFEALRRGFIDTAIAGAYDSALDIDRIEMFGVSGLTSRASDPAVASRPFDRRRDGFVAGEGAAFVVMEALETAQARGAKIYGEVLGYGAATAPFSMHHLGPSAKGFADALDAALADAGGIRPDAVFAHGLATVESDAGETAAMKQVLGSAAAATPLPAVKSMIGNTFAASGTLEAAAALFALRAGALPPTINLTERDPACDLDYVAGASARAAALTTVALNNANLGGAHAALVLGRFA